MKRMHDQTTITAFFVKAGLIAALAAVLLAPMTVNANGKECEDNTSLLKRGAADILPLPPIPHLETMPWLAGAPAQRGFRIDTLLAPKFETKDPEVANGPEPGRLWRPLENSPSAAGVSRNG